MSKSNTCLTYAVSFTEEEAQSIPRTQKLLCKMNARTREPWTVSVKVMKSEDHYQESQEEEEATNTKRRTSKLIAYISTKTCKICQCNVQCFVKQSERHARKSSHLQT